MSLSFNEKEQDMAILDARVNCISPHHELFMVSTYLNQRKNGPFFFHYIHSPTCLLNFSKSFSYILHMNIVKV